MKKENLSFGNSSPDYKPDKYRWVMLALLWLLYVSFGGIIRSLSPLVTPILADLDMSYSQMGLVMGSWQLTYIVAAFASGFLLDKWGIRKSLFLGTVVIALSSGLRYFSQSFGTFLPVVALFGIGGPMLSTGCPKTISMWFRGQERGTAVGIYTTGPWVGGILVLAATNRWIMPLILFPLITLILMDAPEVGSKHMGSASGLFFCISEIGGFMAPLVIGILVDWTGGFTTAGYFMAALCLTIFGLSFLIQETRK